MTILFLFFASSAQAALKMGPLFTDNAVLQRNLPIPIFGTADPDEEITLKVKDETYQTTADENGEWRFDLPAMKIGAPFEIMVSGKKDAVVLKNIVVGDVWVCSGQSNMEFPLNASSTSDEALNSADIPDLRLFQVPHQPSGSPVRTIPQIETPGQTKSVPCQWSQSNAVSAKSFTAVGFFFGRQLHKDLNVPIGLIGTSWGGTPAESWTPRGPLKIDPILKPIDDRTHKELAIFKTAVEKYQKQLDKWVRTLSDDGDAKPAPLFPPDPRTRAWHPSSLYNGMIAPLQPYAIKGAIWYQGESNADRAFQYRTLLPAMIKNWRSTWGQGDFPFLIVQLANLGDLPAQPEESDWAELREAQSMTTATVPKTGLALAIDIGDPHDIHPGDKLTVGKRLALAAHAIAYDETLVYSGPIYKMMKVDKGAVRISFDLQGSGLKTKGDTLHGFAIAGEDRKFVYADAGIDGDQIVVSSRKVPSPVAVRYDWAKNPDGNLYNKEELPAVPFRTDDWPGVTTEKR